MESYSAKLRRVIPFFLIFSISFVAASAHSMGDPVDYRKQWQAGIAKVAITPTESMWMGAYAFRDRPSEGTRHDLWAKALVLKDVNGNRAVFVSTDLVGIRKELSDRIRARLTEKFNLSKTQVILNSSHTHTAPETEYKVHGRHVYALQKEELEKIDRYAKKLEDQIIELVGRALQSFKPAQLYSANGITRFQVNRRNNTESKLLSYTELNGPNDYAVPIIKIVGEKGDIMGIVFGYACHNTVLADYKWSGDYAGYAQLELEKLYPGATALFFQGAGGDQNPLPRRTVSLAQQYGRDLAGAVNRVLGDKMRLLSPHLKTSYSEISLDFANPPPTVNELNEIICDTSSYPQYLKHEARGLLDKLEKGEKLISNYPYPIQVWKLGDQPIIALGGEVVIGYAIKLKQLLGEDIFVFGYCNDVMSYIPTEKVLEEGGYEGTRSPIFTTPWASNIEENIIGEVKRLATLTDIL